MNHYRSGWLALFCLTAVWSCQSNHEEKLVGRWEAVNLLEEGTPLSIDLSQIGITFYPGGSYQYRSTLNYQEAGSYYLAGKTLYRTDTLNQASSERAVEVAFLDADSLVFRMNENGRERLLILKRGPE